MLPGQDDWESVATSVLLATTSSHTAPSSQGRKRLHRGGMCNRSRMQMVQEIMVITHNINKATNLKLQYLLDGVAGLNRAATLSICL